MTWADAAPSLWRAAVVALPFLAIAAFVLIVSITKGDNRG